MVKQSRGGTKRKIKIEKIPQQGSLATAFSKRRNGLYSKISQLCLLTDAQIAVLATPPSSTSNVSFFSFGHSSVDAIVTAYLTGQSPIVSNVGEEETREDLGICMTCRDLGLGSWWEDERVTSSKNLNELMEAMNSMSTLLQKLQKFHSGEEVHKSETTHHETLISDDLPANINNNAVSGSLDQEMEDLDQLIDFNSFEVSDFDHLFPESNDKDNDQTLNSSVCCIPDDDIVNDLPVNFNNNDLIGSLDQLMDFNSFDHHFTDKDQTLNSSICCIPDDDLPKLSDCSEIIKEQSQPAQTLVSPISCCIPDDLSANFNDMTEEQSQILTFCQGFCEETVDEMPSNEEDQRRLLEIYESLWV